MRITEGNIELSVFAEQHGLTQQQLLDKMCDAKLIEPDQNLSGLKYGFLEKFYKEAYYGIIVCWDSTTDEHWWEITPFGKKYLTKLLNINNQ